MSHISQIEKIRERARQHITQGAVTEDYKLDRKQAIAILNEALATEIVCVLRYSFHYFMATGIHSQSVKEEFKEHAAEEQEHASRIAERIKQLGGKPEMNPAILADRSHSEYREGNTLADMIREDLIAERIAVETYRRSRSDLADHDGGHPLQGGGARRRHGGPVVRCGAFDGRRHAPAVFCGRGARQRQEVGEA
jgi:bacterioferritin